MKKQVHKKTIIRDGKEETIVTEDTHIVQDNEGPEELQESMQEIIDQFVEGKTELGEQPEEDGQQWFMLSTQPVIDLPWWSPDDWWCHQHPVVAYPWARHPIQSTDVTSKKLMDFPRQSCDGDVISRQVATSLASHELVMSKEVSQRTLLRDSDMQNQADLLMWHGCQHPVPEIQNTLVTQPNKPLVYM